MGGVPAVISIETPSVRSIANITALWGRYVGIPLAIIGMCAIAPSRVSAAPTPVAGGGGFTLYLTASGDLYTHGYNGTGQLGTGDTTSRLSPVGVGANVVEVAAGGSHSLALTADGSLYVAGNNNAGQLGDRTYTNRTSFVKLSTRNADIRAIADGADHSLAIVGAAGRLYAWGSNAKGQLCAGLAAKTRNRPTNTGIVGVSAAAGGDHHTLLLMQDGAVWACGSNRYGQLGDPNAPQSASPIPVLGLPEPAVAIEAGGEHSLVLTESGNLYAFGRGEFGQLCSGTMANSATPLLVDQGVSNIAGEGPFTVILRQDGTVWTCGHDKRGELGNGEPLQNVAVPVQVIGLPQVTAIGAGHWHGHAVGVDDTVYSWGWNEAGQAGDGTVTPIYSAPVPAYSATTP